MSCRHKNTYFGHEERTDPDKDGNVVVFVREWCRDCGDQVKIHNRRTEKG